MKMFKWAMCFCLAGICAFSAVAQAKTITLDKTKVLVRKAGVQSMKI